MDDHALADMLNGRLDLGRIRSAAQTIYEYDRWNSFDGYAKTADFLAESFARAGADNVQRIALPCDGRYSFGDWIMPRAWDARTGTLELLDATDCPIATLADYRTVPNSLVRWSRPTVPEGEIVELVLLNNADHKESWEETDLAGKMVFIRTDPAKAYWLAKASGAAGVVTDFSTAPTDYPDAVHWCNVWSELGLWGPTADETPLLGFCLTPRQGANLAARLAAAGHPLRVRATVDATLYDGMTEIITTSVRGSDLPEEEIVFYAHVYECHVDDNPVSAAMYLEMVRVLAGLIAAGELPRPRRTLRFVLGWEWIGSDYCAAELKGDQSWIASICHDGVAARQDLTRSPIWLHLSPFFAMSFADALFVHLWEDHFAPHCPDVRWQPMPWAGGTDTHWVDPELGDVSNVYPFQACGPTWHKSGSTLADIDMDVVHHCTLTSLLWALEIANAGGEQAVRFARVAADRMVGIIADHACDYDWQLRGVDTRQQQFAREQSCLREQAERMIDTTILAPADPHLREETYRQMARIEQALTAGREKARETAMRVAARQPAWERSRPTQLNRAQAERLADNVIIQRQYTGLVRSGWRLPPEKRKTVRLNSLIQFQADGRKSLLELARRAEFDQGTRLDLRAELRHAHALAGAGYLTCRHGHIFAANDLAAGLRRLGIEAGDTVLVHSSLAAVGPLSDGPESVFTALREAVGDTGTVVFPAFAFNTVKAYPDSPFDVARTPSRVGRLSDLFWRQPGVRRSAHPSHGIAALGPAAEHLTAGVLQLSPFDMRGSFGRLYALDAKILMLGCGLAPNTAMHVLEDWADLPSLAPDTYHYLDADGRRQEIVYDREPFHTRSFYTDQISPYERLMRDRGLLREGSVGLAMSFAMRLRDLLDTGMEELRHGRFDILFDPDSPDPRVCSILEKLAHDWSFPESVRDHMRALKAEVGI